MIRYGTEANQARQWLRGEQLGQALVDFPFFLSGFQSVIPQDGDARAVIAAVFQAPQPRQKDGGRLLFAHVANDAAHKEFLGF